MYCTGWLANKVKRIASHMLLDGGNYSPDQRRGPLSSKVPIPRHSPPRMKLAVIGAIVAAVGVVVLLISALLVPKVRLHIWRLLRHWEKWRNERQPPLLREQLPGDAGGSRRHEDAHNRGASNSDLAEQLEESLPAEAEAAAADASPLTPPAFSLRPQLGLAAAPSQTTAPERLPGTSAVIVPPDLAYQPLARGEAAMTQWNEYGGPISNQSGLVMLGAQVNASEGGNINFYISSSRS
jgi:hypothetical protein